MQDNYPDTLVTFRITSADLDPDNVTNMLNIQPTKAYKAGYRPRNNSRYMPRRKGFWGIGSSLRQEPELEKHLRSLLGILEPKSHQIRELAESAEIGFYCSLFDVAGAEISGELIARIAKLGASLTFVIYAIPDNDLGGKTQRGDDG